MCIPTSAEVTIFAGKGQLDRKQGFNLNFGAGCHNPVENQNFLFFGQEFIEIDGLVPSHDFTVEFWVRSEYAKRTLFSFDFEFWD
jgi:hypothetical protein